MNCPDCGGAMWDNRESKRSPKQPDYKCKNKQCDKAVWLQKRDGSENGQSATNGTGGGPTVVNRALGPLYAECLDFAVKACRYHFGDSFTPSDVIASAATLFIQAVKDGAPIRAAKPAPPPPPPPREPEPVYENAHDLPF